MCTANSIGNIFLIILMFGKMQFAKYLDESERTIRTHLMR